MRHTIGFDDRGYCGLAFSRLTSILELAGSEPASNGHEGQLRVRAPVVLRQTNRRRAAVSEPVQGISPQSPRTRLEPRHGLDRLREII